MVSLEQYRGQAVLLVFYPADFTPVCASELGIFNELLPGLHSIGAQALGLSVDSVWTHVAFAGELHIEIPLLADFQPKGEVCRRYDVYREEDGFSERALFVVDAAGVIAWSHVSPIEINPGVDQALEALERCLGRTLGDGQAPADAQVQR